MVRIGLHEGTDPIGEEACHRAIVNPACNFASLDARLSTMESSVAALQAKTTYAAQATGQTTAKGVANFQDITGASLTFTTAANATVELMAAGELLGTGAVGSGTIYDAACALRFVVDATAMGDSTGGDGVMAMSMTDGALGSVPAVITRRLSNLAAGQHSVKVQVAVYASSKLPPGAYCRVQGVDQGFGALTLFATVR